MRVKLVYVFIRYSLPNLIPLDGTPEIQGRSDGRGYCEEQRAQGAFNCLIYTCQ
jgi:hypothetical protein